MSHGRLARHTILVLACVAVIAGSTGCRRSPFQRLADDTAPESARYVDRSQMPQLLPVPDDEIQPAKADVVVHIPGSSKADPAVREANASGQTAQANQAPKPTPLLDAALKRALAEEQLQHQAVHPVSRKAESAGPPEGLPKTTEKPKSAAPPAALAAATPHMTHEKPKPVLRKVDEPPAKPKDPPLSWEDSVGKLKKLAQESASKSPADDSAALWRVRAQVMDWMASESTPAASKALLKKAVVTMADAMDARGQDASAQTAGIRMAVLELEDRVPLGMTNMQVCRNVLGFGSFESIDPATLKVGQPVWLYCELTGLHYRNSGQTFVSRLSSRVELLDIRTGGKVWEQSLGEAEDQCRSHRRDNFVNFRFNLPPDVKPGDYRLRLTQTDMVANQTASAELAVTVMRNAEVGMRNAE